MIEVIKPSFQIIKDKSGDEIIQNLERYGRVCYKSEDRITPDSAKTFIASVIKRGHEAVIEHEKVTVQIVCDRGVTHEIVRHRIGSYCQESTRYCNYSKEKFGGIKVIPMMQGLTHSQIERRMELWDHMERVYMAETGEGVTPQQARDNLPTCLKTEIVVTYNLREWRHFFKLRCATTAHPQMREITIPLLEAMKEYIPVIFDDLTTQ